MFCSQIHGILPSLQESVDWSDVSIDFMGADAHRYDLAAIMALAGARNGCKKLKTGKLSRIRFPAKCARVSILLRLIRVAQGHPALA